MNLQNKQYGAAIIIALFVTALTAALSIAMMVRLSIDTRRTELFIQSIQNDLIAQGSVALAEDQLNNNWNKKQTGRLVDKTPIIFYNKDNNMEVTTTIDDAQRSFNLNNVGNDKADEDFLKLLRTVFPNLPIETAKNIILGVADWIKPGIKNSPFDQYYMQLNPSYRAPHQPMTSVSELRLIKGVTADIYNALLPYVTALPEVTKANVNSVSAPVLAALSPPMTLATANNVVVYRTKNPFITLEQFANLEIIKNNPVPANKITVTSDYFLVQSKIVVNGQPTLLFTLMKRGVKENKSFMTVLWQTKGTL